MAELQSKIVNPFVDYSRAAREAGEVAIVTAVPK
jgi:hypothetical protein